MCAITKLTIAVMGTKNDKCLGVFGPILIAVTVMGILQSIVMYFNSSDEIAYDV